VTLDGTSWVVVGVTLDGAQLTPPEDRLPTMIVEAGRVSGTTGCNTYDAAITVSADGAVAVTGLSVTEIGCGTSVMEFEAGFLDALLEVDRFTWDGDRLSLHNEDRTAAISMVAAVPDPDVGLGAVVWRLDGITAGEVATSVLAGTRPTLVVDLDGGAVRGNGGCNDFGARAVVAGDRITISEMVSTEMACAEAIMRQEADYFRSLADAATWRVTGASLLIATTDGRSLTFRVEPGDQP
jgi:heat shock protein HslJ